MRLIAILISLWASRFPDWLDSWRRSDVFFRYADWLRQRVLGGGYWQGPVGLLAFMLPPVLVVALLQWLVGGWLLGLVIAVVALLFAHGPGRNDHDMDEFLTAWEQEDLTRAQRSSLALSGALEGPATAEELPQEALQGLFWQAYRRVLGPMFWFVLLGAWGAILFRFAYLAKEYADVRHEADEPFERAVSSFLYVLDWIPTRLTALGLGLAGSFVHAMQGWRDVAPDRNPRRLVIRAAEGALNMPLTSLTPDAVTAIASEARSLITRTTLVWLAVIALATIFGWLG